MDKTPCDCLEYGEKYNGICGEAAIAALLETNLKTVFDIGKIDRETFKGFTLQKDMIRILNNLGYTPIQKKATEKYKLPDCNKAIIRVSFGEPNQHWMKTAKLSHYIAIKRFAQGRFVYDNAINEFDGKPVNGVWIEESEYYKVMTNQKMFITSYLEV